MSTEFEENLFDLGPKSQHRPKRNKLGKRVYTYLKPELPPGTPIPESPPPKPVSPEQKEVNDYLDKLSHEFLEESTAGTPLIYLLKLLARRQGEVTLLREKPIIENWQIIEKWLTKDTFVAKSISFQKRLIDLVLGLPHREQSHAQFADRLSSILKENLGNEFTLATQLISGCLATITLIDILGLLEEASHKNSPVVVDPAHDQYFATDLEIRRGNHLYLFQIKTSPFVENPIEILNDGDQEFDWKKRMLDLKKIMAGKLRLPEQNIHLVLANVPPMWTDDIEAYTGFLKPEARYRYKQAYLTPLAEIGFRPPSPDIATPR